MARLWLLAHLQEHTLEGINTGAVMIDLMQFEQVLVQAEAHDVRFPNTDQIDFTGPF